MREYTIAHFDAQERAEEKLDLNGLLRFAADYRPEVSRHKLKKPRKRWTFHKILSVCSLRLGDIQRIILGLYGGPCDTDDGELFFSQALPHLIARHVAYEKPESAMTEMLMAWAYKHTRRVYVEHPREWFEQQAEPILVHFGNDDGRPSIPDGDSVSVALSVRQAWIQEFKLHTLTAIERPRRVRKAETNAKKAKRQGDRRISEGATPRRDSISARKPWEDLGISRATWYRQIADGTLTPDPVMCLSSVPSEVCVVGTNTSH